MKINISRDIKLNINNSRTGFDTVIVGSSQDTQVETPTLLPALLLSVLLNIVTGGHILLSNVKASKKRDSTIGFNGLKDILPTIKDSLPRLTNSLFAKKEGLPSLSAELMPPKDDLPMYGDFAMPKDSSYYQDDTEIPASQVDLNDLYSMLSDWSDEENLGELELPPTAIEALNYQESNRESSKLERRGGGNIGQIQQQHSYNNDPVEHRFTNLHVQDSYYNLPKSF